ncbi:MAG TPA: ribosome-associated translation inhibitor RaiA [Candidatus Thiothrix moscowensis]|uniref:ribosome hibernation-promoting factor, HPF/YfiA family n=1 Tax=unclassified Thiothrix TaxID=2636184 RepID=UPI0025FDB19B|nr:MULTISPECIES: ribosome-associated translation inhibitor RaiA [unclassified Thiothrix]HRJ53384.1 ribosome-associated translation inhibitor RaiA [Candidatus Thiothrix moscowensis]HRJ94639.1 ribosome-associated translation inhibitor RaiA [Candidatus Thiothrix moscowensis]
MQLEITGHHLEVTDSMSTYIREKSDRLKRHFDKVMNIHFILEVEKQRHKAEATLHVSGNHIFADAHAEDMYAAIDSLVDKLDRQIVKHKEKLKNHHRQESGHMASAVAAD